MHSANQYEPQVSVCHLQSQLINHFIVLVNEC